MPKNYSLPPPISTLMNGWLEINATGIRLKSSQKSHLWNLPTLVQRFSEPPFGSECPLNLHSGLGNQSKNHLNSHLTGNSSCACNIRCD